LLLEASDDLEDEDDVVLNGTRLFVLIDKGEIEADLVCQLLDVVAEADAVNVSVIFFVGIKVPIVDKEADQVDTNLTGLTGNKVAGLEKTREASSQS